MWNLKQKKMHRENRNTHIENKLMVAREEGAVGWVEKVKGNKKYKLPVTK